MGALIWVSNFLDVAINRIAKIAGWAGVLLIAVTIFDVVTRRFLVLGSTKLQEAEWHLHTILLMLLLGCAYLRDTHVRIDLVRERLSERIQWWIELIGCLVFLLPFCALVVYFGYDFTVRSYETQEVSASATGLSHRWIIKSFVPIGFTLLGLAGVTVLLRKVVELFGPPELRAKAHEIEEAEEAHLVDLAIKEAKGRSEGGG